ncbi:MAG: 50S ribosomal protein L4 [Chloroflexi bacterium]|nr:MAG: 50S ribosomal protein L4 [Chloroflexota bacterium]
MAAWWCRVRSASAQLRAENAPHVIREHDLNLEKSTRNLVSVKTILVGNLNPTDVLIADTIVFTRSTLDDLEGWLG